LATASADCTSNIWDTRKLTNPINTLKFHKDEINCISFNPHYENLLATASNDRRIVVWDLSRQGMPLEAGQDATDGPSEMLFLHGGHTSKISDMGWNQNEKLMVASVAEDNILQIWQMAKEIFYS
jgi:histone-binding protein RBBP4